MREYDVKDVNTWEKEVIENCTNYSVWVYGGYSPRSMKNIPTFEEAFEYAKESLRVDERLRSCIIYAVNEYKNHAMIGYYHREVGWKPVERD